MAKQYSVPATWDDVVHRLLVEHAGPLGVPGALANMEIEDLIEAIAAKRPEAGAIAKELVERDVRTVRAARKNLERRLKGKTVKELEAAVQVAEDGIRETMRKFREECAKRKLRPDPYEKPLVSASSVTPP